MKKEEGFTFLVLDISRFYLNWRHPSGAGYLSVYRDVGSGADDLIN